MAADATRLDSKTEKETIQGVTLAGTRVPKERCLDKDKKIVVAAEVSEMDKGTLVNELLEII